MRLVQRTVSLQPGESQMVTEDYCRGGALLEVAAFGEGDSTLFLDGQVEQPSRSLDRAELSVLWLAKLWPKAHPMKVTDSHLFTIGHHGLYVRLPESAEHPVLVVLFMAFD